MYHSLLAQVVGEDTQILGNFENTLHDAFPLKNRTVIGDHDPILLEKTHLFATTTYYAY